MAKGSVAKQEIFNKMMEAFPGSFMFNNNKELRINCMEDGELVQIKVTLTAAKDAITPDGGEPVISMSQPVVFDDSTAAPPFDSTSEPAALDPQLSEPREEEKANLQRLIANMF